MKSNIKYVILFIGIIVILDLFIGFYVKKKFINLTYGKYGSINKSITSDAEILILGSSRAMHHYNPEIISNILGYTCRNTGLGGHGIFLNYAILNESIKKNIPKIVILDVSPNVIVDANSYSKLNILLPYYKDYTSFKEIIELDPKYSGLEMISNLYVYNSTLYDFTRNYLQKKTKSKNGYIPLNGKIIRTKFEPFYYENEIIDENKIKYLKKIISICKVNNIRLIGVVSPTYTKYDTNNQVIDKLKVIFEENQTEFFDFSNYQKFYQKSDYFKDQLHMNSMGTSIFSEDLALRLKPFSGR